MSDYFNHKSVLAEKSIRLQQNDIEFEKLCEIVKERDPRVLVEIGTNAGGSLYMLSQYVNRDCLIISIDLPGGPWGKVSNADVRIRVADLIKEEGGWVKLIGGDSTSAVVLDELHRILAGRPIDVLFIDGDHSFEGVMKDWNIYHQFVAEGGMVAFHDVDNSPKFPKIGVHQLWNVLKGKYPHSEFIENPTQGFGIGALYL